MKKILPKVLLVICVIGLIFAGYNLFSIFSDYKEADDEYVEIKKTYTQVIKHDNEEEKEVRSIDFDELKKVNEDIIGWIWLEDTKIDYPILQSHDNDEYLHQTFNGTKNSSGSIFVDARCEGLLNDNNTIIHGHNMKDGSMFHTLNSFYDEEFYNEHRTFWIYTPEEAAEYEIISLYVGNANSNGYYTEDSEETYEEWLSSIAKKSLFEAADYDVNKKTITLSTCRGSAGTTTRFMIHLQKKEG